ncbi:MAG: heavy-metal-associated domain-containing protein [Anaeromyxobacteraceae bacterium]|nr:heavy-metal-associated domain-containing protein [Anaeromyxobacteraceae bacterium]
MSLHVEGMTCASCKVAVRTALTKLEGVKDARGDVAKKSATVDYDPIKVTPQQLVDAANRLGYQASLSAKRGS